MKKVKKLKLRSWVKDVLLFGACLCFITIFAIIWQIRMTEIEKNTNTTNSNDSTMVMVNGIY